VCAGLQYAVSKHLCERLQRGIEFTEYKVSKWIPFLFFYFYYNDFKFSYLTIFLCLPSSGFNWWINWKISLFTCLGTKFSPRDQDNFHVKQKNISVVLPSYPINIRVNLSRGLIIFGHTNRDEYSDLVNVFKKNQLKSSDEKRYEYQFWTLISQELMSVGSTLVVSGGVASNQFIRYINKDFSSAYRSLFSCCAAAKNV